MRISRAENVHRSEADPTEHEVQSARRTRPDPFRGECIHAGADEDPRDAGPVVATRRRETKTAVIGQRNRTEDRHDQKGQQPPKRHIEEQPRIVPPPAEEVKVNGQAEDQTDSRTEILRIVAEELRPIGHQVVGIERRVSLRIDGRQISLWNNQQPDNHGRQAGHIQNELHHEAAQRPEYRVQNEPQSMVETTVPEVVRAHTDECGGGREPIGVEPIEGTFVPASAPVPVQTDAGVTAQKFRRRNEKQVGRDHCGQDKTEGGEESRQAVAVDAQGKDRSGSAESRPKSAHQKDREVTIPDRLPLTGAGKRHRVHVRNRSAEPPAQSAKQSAVTDAPPPIFPLGEQTDGHCRQRSGNPGPRFMSEIAANSPTN